MARKHSELMLVLFPSQEAIGPDLGNIEIKESLAGFQKFTIKNKDMDDAIDFFLFYDQQLETFWFCPADMLPYVKKKASYTVPMVARCAMWTTKDVVEVIEWMRPYITDQKYLEVLN